MLWCTVVLQALGPRSLASLPAAALRRGRGGSWQSGAGTAQRQVLSSAQAPGLSNLGQRQGVSHQQALEGTVSQLQLLPHLPGKRRGHRPLPSAPPLGFNLQGCPGMPETLMGEGVQHTPEPPRSRGCREQLSLTVALLVLSGRQCHACTHADKWQKESPALHDALCPLLRMISWSFEQRWG